MEGKEMEMDAWTHAVVSDGTPEGGLLAMIHMRDADPTGRIDALLAGGTVDGATLRGTEYWDPTGDAVLEMTPDGVWRMKCGWSDWEWTEVEPVSHAEYLALLGEGAIHVVSPVEDADGAPAWVFLGRSDRWDGARSGGPWSTGRS